MLKYFEELVPRRTKCERFVKKFAIQFAYMFLMKRIITELNRSWHHTVMPASIEMSNYYFHQISSFYCFNILMYYALLIAGGTYRSLVTPLCQDRRKLKSQMIKQ